VQVTSIEPVISKQGDVSIRLRVSGDRERAVQLVRNLETSQRFLSPRLVSEQAQTQEGNHNAAAAQLTAPGAVQFDILSGYNPLPDRRVKEVVAKETKVGSTAGGSIARAKKRVAAKGSGVKGSAATAPVRKAVPR
jgi:type IV pilus assembly protein PilN